MRTDKRRKLTAYRVFRSYTTQARKDAHKIETPLEIQVTCSLTTLTTGHGGCDDGVKEEDMDER